MIAYRLADVESTLRQREEEIAQAWSELGAEREAKATLEAEFEKIICDAEQRSRKLEEAEAWVFKLAGDRQAAEKHADILVQTLASERKKRAAADGASERLQAHIHAASEREREAARVAEQAQSSIELLRESLARAGARSSVLERELGVANDRFAVLSAESHLARSKESELKAQIGERFNEIAMLAQLLRREEGHAEEQGQHAEWLREVYLVLRSKRWWWAFMPAPWQRRRELRRLARRGLFDGEAYLARYADVAQAGTDPLRHYILHGMAEGRSRAISSS
jgi:chromosome segregation ATPase